MALAPPGPPELASPEFSALANQCIHCGLCLSACPTYVVFGRETDSPRGRIALMKAAASGALTEQEFDAAFRPHIDLCLGCLACQTACPSGVQYGLLIETARGAVEHHRKPGAIERFMRWAGLRIAMPRVGLMKALARLLAVYERLGLQRLVRGLNVLPGALRAMEAILPPLTPAYSNYAADTPARGERRGRVIFLHGCIQEAFLPGVNQATIRVLQRNGYDVHVPAGQTCCGAAQVHTGDEQFARELARRNIDACAADDVVAIISNAGGCGAQLKAYPRLLAHDPDYATKARAFAAKVMDINEFLAGHLHAPPERPLNLRVTYADSCHLRHGQGVVRQPRELLQRVPGLTLVELAAPDRCCGSAGVYNILQPETAGALLDLKMADIAAARPDVIVTTNTGCHLQLIAGARKAGLAAPVKHVVQILDQAYGDTAT